METAGDTNPFTGLGTFASLNTVLLADTQMMATLTPPAVTEADLKFVSQTKQETGPEFSVEPEQNNYVTFDDLAKLYQCFGPPDSDDSM